MCYKFIRKKRKTNKKQKNVNATVLFILIALVAVLIICDIVNLIIVERNRVIQQRNRIVEVRRNIDNQGDLYAITLNVNVNEEKGINAFVISEYYPKGWEVQSVSHGGVYNTSSRLNKGVIEWLGSEFTELKAEDAVISYVVKKTNGNNVFDGDWVVKNPENNITVEGGIQSDSDEELATIGIFGSSDNYPTDGSEYYPPSPTPPPPTPAPTPTDGSEDYTPDEPITPEPYEPVTPDEPVAPTNGSEDYTPTPIPTDGSEYYPPSPTPPSPTPSSLTPTPLTPTSTPTPAPTEGSDDYTPKKQKEDPCDNECKANISMSKKGNSQFELYGDVVEKASMAANKICNENPKFGSEYSCKDEQEGACCKRNNLVRVVNAKIYPEKELSGTCLGSLSGTARGNHVKKIGLFWWKDYENALKEAGGKAQRNLEEQLKSLECGDGCIREINISEARTRITTNLTTEGQFYEATITLPFTAKCVGEKSKRKIIWVADVDVELHKQCSMWKWEKDLPEGCKHL